MRTLLNSGLRASRDGAHQPRRYSKTKAEPVAPVTTTPPVAPADTPADPDGAVSEPVGDPQPTPVAVPDGMTKVADLTTWVGDDPAKAQAVLDVEQAKPEKDQRKTLVANMQAIVEQHDLI